MFLTSQLPICRTSHHFRCFIFRDTETKTVLYVMYEPVPRGLAQCPDYFNHRCLLAFIICLFRIRKCDKYSRAFSDAFGSDTVIGVHLMLHWKQAMPRQAVHLCCIAVKHLWPLVSSLLARNSRWRCLGALYSRIEVTKAADSKCQMKPDI